MKCKTTAIKLFKLKITDVFSRTHNTGHEHVLSTLRQRVWLLQARTLVRQVLRKCFSCRRRNGAPMQQLMADLPKERLIPFESPFTYTGVEVFGLST